MRVAAALVTHNAERWLRATLTSILDQSRPVDEVVVVDDNSIDGTRRILDEFGVRVEPARTSASDVTTRIAANFEQAVASCSDHDLVALGDHDDVWHATRVESQEHLMSGPAIMVASDGVIVDEKGTPTGQTLRSTFPVPSDWATWDAASRMRFALRHSIATGGASMIRPDAFPDLEVPDGWLHDRWWSLVATAREGMLVDHRPVIDYRVQPDQAVGLDVAAQGRGPVGRLAALVGQGRLPWLKQRDLRRRLRPMAVSPEVASAVTWRNVM